MPINTPNYAGRRETGSLHLSYSVLKNTLNWILKISQMNPSRYPRKCFERLSELARGDPGCRHNWPCQLRGAFGGDTLKVKLNDLSLESIGHLRSTILVEFCDSLKASDEESFSKSGSLLIYRSLSVEAGPQAYLTSRFSLKQKRIFAQIRLLNWYVCRINFGHFSYKNLNEGCIFCGLENESLFHILNSCPAYAHLCCAAFPEIYSSTDTTEGWLRVMSSRDSKTVLRFVSLIEKILMERAVTSSTSNFC